MSDPQKRGKYDSSLDFDDSIPTEKKCVELFEDDMDTAEREKAFFDLFGPVFKRNKKWSKRQPVPELPAPTKEGAEPDFKARFNIEIKNLP